MEPRPFRKKRRGETVIVTRRSDAIKREWPTYPQHKQFFFTDIGGLGNVYRVIADNQGEGVMVLSGLRWNIQVENETETATHVIRWALYTKGPQEDVLEFGDLEDGVINADVFLVNKPQRLWIWDQLQLPDLVDSTIFHSKMVTTQLKSKRTLWPGDELQFVIQLYGVGNADQITGWFSYNVSERPVDNVMRRR